MEQASFLFGDIVAPAMVMPAAPRLHDADCRRVTAANPNMLVPWLLSSAYAYSCLDQPIISDSLYDQMSIELARVWDSTEHFHKHLLQRGWFPKGSIPLVEGQFPSRIVFATMRMAQP